MAYSTLRRWARLAISAVTLTTLAACGGSDGDGGSGGGGTYTVGGTASGLTGSGLVLQINGGDDLGVSAAGAFTFATALANGTAYAITVAAQPSSPSQDCVVTNGTGTVGAANITDVAVVCTAGPPVYSVSGLVTGFRGRANSELILQSNLGGFHAFLDGRPRFAFGGFASGAAYAVTVRTQPPGWHCEVKNGTGVMGTADVTNVSVVCTTPGHFAYASNAGDDTITVYSIDSTTGALAAVGTPVAAGASPYAIVGSPDRKHVYVVNQTSNNVSAFSVDALNGALTPVAGSPFAAGTNPKALAFDQSGAFLYVANNGSNNLSAYAVNADTGVLTPLATATYPTGTGPAAVSVYSSSLVGDFVYVANNGGSNDISVYAVAADTGALTEIVGSPFAAGGNSHSLAFVPLATTNFSTALYSANADGTGSSISGFGVDASSGALTVLDDSPFAVAVSHNIASLSGRLYVTTGSSVAGYTVDGQTGLLTASAGFPVAAGTNAYSVTPGLNGVYVYVCNNGGASISAYSTDVFSGQLTAVPGSPFAAGNLPDFIAIL